ncbi:alkaline phosphatase D family protein [Streptomyces caelestis]
MARVAAHAPGARPRSPGRAAAGRAYGATPHVPGPEPDDPARTLTGDAQERRPLDGGTSTALWNVMRRQMCFSPRGPAPNAEAKGSMDARDGYRATRGRPAAGAKAAGVADWAGPHLRRPRRVRLRHQGRLRRPRLRRPGHGADLHLRRRRPRRRGAPGPWDTCLRADPHLRFHDGRRGHARIEPGAVAPTAASFVTEVGPPGPTPVRPVRVPGVVRVYCTWRPHVSRTR